MANAFIKSIQTIAKSLVDNAGYDKTRSGQIVGVNSITNTYSVKIDGQIYPNVRTVNDLTYNIHDIVKVVIPCNQATQMYIESSVLSDASIGSKVADAQSVADRAEQLGLDNQTEIENVSEVANSKNKTYRQSDEPTEGMSNGDIWIDTDDGNKMYIWDGTQWVFSGGGDGQDGLNNATILLYQRGATAPNKPTADLTYTFATASLSPTSALNGWTQDIPTIDGNPCWVIAATATATTDTDVIAVDEWSIQIKFVEDGATGATGQTGATGATGATGSAGLNNATVLLYKRGATAPAKPTAQLTYTFATGVLSGALSGWSQTIPTIDGNPCWVIAVTASSNSATDTIPASEWSTQVKFVEDGATGETGATGATGETGTTGLNQATVFLYSRTTSTKPSGGQTYTFSTGKLSTVPSGWSQEIPSGTNPCYVTTGVAIGTGTTTTVSAWADVSKFVEDGATGDTGATGATGDTGDTGATGLSLRTNTVFLYSRTTSTKPPSGSYVYNFNENTLTPMPTNWYLSIPSGTTPCYVVSAVAISYETTATITTWSDPTLFVKNGTDGETGVSIRNRGEWATGQSYTKGTTGNSYIDIVTLNGNTYICNTSHTSSNTNKPPNATYWVLGAAQGDTGATGATGNTGATGATGVAPEGLVEVIVSAISYPSQTATLKATLFVNGVARSTGITDYHWYRVVGTTTTDMGHGSTMSTLSINNLNAIYRCVITWT